MVNLSAAAHELHSTSLVTIRKKFNSFVLAILAVAVTACDGTGTIVDPDLRLGG